MNQINNHDSEYEGVDKEFMHNQIADSLRHANYLRCPRQTRTHSVRMLCVFAKQHMILVYYYATKGFFCSTEHFGY